MYSIVVEHLIHLYRTVVPTALDHLLNNTMVAIFDNESHAKQLKLNACVKVSTSLEQSRIFHFTGVAVSTFYTSNSR